MFAEAELLSQLISDIYDAALDPALWNSVLEKSGAFTGGRAAGLVSKDAVSKAANVFYETGIEPKYVRSYVETYTKFDPATTGQFFADIEQAVTVTDLMPYEEFQETRFYKEWLEPQGWIDALTAPLDKSATSLAAVTVFRHRHDGHVDDKMRRLMRLIVPHIRRAVLIGKVIDLKKTEAATLAATLDGLAAGMFLVDASGRIVFANASGHSMLAQGSLLRAVNGKLAPSEAEAERALHDVFAAAGGGDIAVGGKGIALPLKSLDGGHHVAHVLPLTSGARRQTGITYSAVAAVFVRQAESYLRSPMEAIARLYKLTPSELRVLGAIVEIGGAPAAADALGISEGTVKSHLHRLFVKTGLRRQVDLAKLVAAHASPFAQ